MNFFKDWAAPVVPVSSVRIHRNFLADEEPLDFRDFQSMSLSNFGAPEFNTLRSEDLNALLSEPMFNSTEEWEVVEQMAEC